MNSIFHGRFSITGCFLQHTGYWAPPHKPHTGLDLVARDSPNIYSPLTGTVEFTGNAGDGFGNYVRILGNDGRKYYFCHMASFATFAGKRVSPGIQIGVMGHSGNVTGAHTHFEIRSPRRDGGYDLGDPAAFLGLPNRQGDYVYAAEPAPIIHIDIPCANGVINRDTAIEGWMIHARGGKRADVYLDGSIPIGSTHTLTERGDVARAFNGKGYRSPDYSGIHFILPYSRLPKGRHTLGVAGIPADGSAAVWTNIPITVR